MLFRSEDYFDIKVNLEEKSAFVDGNTINLTDLFAISELELNEMLSNNSFRTYLSENLIGDIEDNGVEINIDNPYSTKSLIIETKEKSIIEDYKNITNVEKIAEDIYIVEFENAKETKKVYEELQEEELIENIIKDHKVHISDNNFQIESVSTRNTAWGVDTTGLGHYKLKLNYSENDNDIIVAVLDTGINSSHEAFNINEIADKISFTYSYDYVNDDSDVTDDNGHGTAVAGVISESTSDNIKIVPVKVMNESGEGTLTDILQAIEDVYQYVDVINLSLGTNTDEFSKREKSTLEKFFKQVYNSGTIVVCAAGNEKTDVAYPGSSSYTLTASAVDSANNFASSFSNYGEEVDFALPYMNVALGVVSPDSNVITSLDDLTGDDQVIVISGTTAETYLTENYPDITLQKYDAYAEAKTALENGNGVCWANDNTEVIAFALQNEGYTVGIPSLGSADTIAPAVTKGNTSLLEWLNSEIETLGEENFFHSDYEATLIDTYGSDYEEELVVEGGKAESHELEIGSNSFIPGFEDQIIGMKVDEEKDIKVKFPDDYFSKDLAGKDAVFKIKLHEIKEKKLPELDDEFAKDVSEFDTLKELKADIKSKKQKENDDRAKRELEDSAIDAVVKNTPMDIPSGMIDTEVANMISDMEQQLSYQGITLDQYLKILKKTRKEIEDGYKEQAEKNVKARLIIEAIIKAEKIEADKKEIDEKLKEMAKQYGQKEDEIKNNEPLKEYIEESIKSEKAVEFIVKNAKIK